MRRTAESGRTRIPVLVLAVLALLLYSSCGGSGSSGESGDTNVTPTHDLKLNLRSSQSIEGNYQVELLAVEAASLYQLSTRLTYNASAVRPLGPAQSGNLPAADAIFYSNDRQSGYIPVAFTNRQAQSVSQSSGVVFRVSFAVIDPSLDPGFDLLRSAEYLIARDNTAQDIDLEIEVEK